MAITSDRTTSDRASSERASSERATSDRPATQEQAVVRAAVEPSGHPVEAVFLLVLMALPAVVGLGRWLGAGPRAVPLARVALAGALHRDRRQRLGQEFATGFFGRAALLKAYAVGTERILHTPSTPKVVYGRDGWLFYSGEESNLSWKTYEPCSQEDLERLAAAVERRRAWLAARGVRYLLVVAPDKDTVYPDMLPAARRPPRPSRLEQSLTYLRAHTRAEIVDLTPTLRAARAPCRAYYLTDTHWNPFGAAAASDATVQPLKSQWPLSSLNALTTPISMRGHYSGDLAGMLDFAGELTEPKVEPRLPPQRPVVTDESTVTYMDLEHDGMHMHLLSHKAFLCPGAPGPRLLMVGDSFGEAMLSYLAPNFRRFVYERAYSLDHSLVERERPAIVIQEAVERAVPDLAREDP